MVQGKILSLETFFEEWNEIRIFHILANMTISLYDKITELDYLLLLLLFMSHIDRAQLILFYFFIIREKVVFNNKSIQRLLHAHDHKFGA